MFKKREKIPLKRQHIREVKTSQCEQFALICFLNEESSQLDTENRGAQNRKETERGFHLMKRGYYTDTDTCQA